MLKRLSATFSNNSASSLHETRFDGHHTDRPAAYHRSSSQSVLPAAYMRHDDGLLPNDPLAYLSSSYPRPAALSTPSETSITTPGYHQAPSSYFAGTHSSASSVKGGSDTRIRSRTSSPLPSPVPSDVYAPAAGPSFGAARAPAVDRATLQKSLRTLEGLLVSLDEYRDLHLRLAKLEKRLGKNVKDLAVCMETNTLDGSTSARASQTSTAPSIVQSLHAVSAFYDVLSEVSVKHSRAIAKEYDAVNESSSRAFKRIAKEERTHDELLEDIEIKLKKANLEYDRRVRATLPNTSRSMYSDPRTAQGSYGAAAAAHEQFVPILNALTDDMARVRAGHAQAMGARREDCIRFVARSLVSLCEADFQDACESTRRSGSEIGGILASGALLGSKEADGKRMPRDWPAPLLSEEPLEMESALNRESQHRIDATGNSSGSLAYSDTSRPSEAVRWRPAMAPRENRSAGPAPLEHRASGQSHEVQTLSAGFHPQIDSRPIYDDVAAIGSDLPRERGVREPSPVGVGHTRSSGARVSSLVQQYDRSSTGQRRLPEAPECDEHGTIRPVRDTTSPSTSQLQPLGGADVGNARTV